jgi:hypothetical protein
MPAFASTFLNGTFHTPRIQTTSAKRQMAKVKLTPAQKSAKEKAQHTKLVEEVMAKLDEADFAYVNQGQRDAIKAHTNLVIVLHMVLDDVKEFKKRLDTWCSWNPGTPGVFAPKKTEEEKQKDREASAAAAAAAEAAIPEDSTPPPPKASSTTTRATPAAASKKATKKEEEQEEEGGDDVIFPDEDAKPAKSGKAAASSSASGKFDLKDFVKSSGVPSKQAEAVVKKLKDAGFTQSTLSEVNDSYFKKLGIAASERTLLLKGAFEWLSKHPQEDD